MRERKPRVPSPDGYGRKEQYPENMVGKGYYRDTGCPGGCEKSLECPLPRCRYDVISKKPRNAEIREMKADGCDMLTLMVHFGLSNRQVHRILAEKGKQT